jgi:hypothetical protein
MCWSGSSVRADLCTMTGDRRLLQIDKEKMVRSRYPVPSFEGWFGSWL